MDATRIGAISSAAKSCRCPINGNSPGSPPGIWRSTAWRWHWSIRNSPKQQLVLLGREWFMHPNGQLPAYEWAFGDVNPPVHAWAAWRVYQIDRKHHGHHGDRKFLEKVFHKLLLNFTWWVNRKDAENRNVFDGGFLGLDNIARVRSQRPAADGRPDGAGRQHRLDGDVLLEPDANCAGAGAARLGLRKHRHEILRAFLVDRRSDEPHRQRAPPKKAASACGTMKKNGIARSPNFPAAVRSA